MIASQFCLGKSNQNRVRRNASFRCRPLPANRKKPWAAIIFRGLFFFNGPQDCCAVSPGYLVASIPCMRKLFGSCLFFSGPQEALRGLLCPGPIHRLAGFPRFFPKLFCGREVYFHDKVIAETKPSLSGCSAW